MPWLIEFVAGIIETGEDPEDVVAAAVTGNNAARSKCCSTLTTS